MGAAIILIAPLLLLLRRRKSKGPGAATEKALSESDAAEASFEGQLASRAASQDRLDAEALLTLRLPAAGTKKSEVLSKHLKKSVKDDPGVSAQLLRTWINENET